MENRKFVFYRVVDFPDSLSPFISKNEEVKFAVKTVRDVAVVTDKRLLIADKQGFTGKKVEYYSIPYKNIITYAVETAGTFDFDSEIKLVLSGGLEIELSFMKDSSLNGKLIETYNIITDYIVG